MPLLKYSRLLQVIKCPQRFSSIYENSNNFILRNLNKVYINSTRSLFWERSRKGGYDTTIKVSTREHLINGFKLLISETKLWIQEWREILAVDKPLIARPGEVDVLWCFDKPSVLENFIATCDSDHKEGYSTCKFEMSSAGRALFHGYIDSRLPKDGRTKRAGYAAIRSIRVKKSFQRDATYDWHLYNALVLKVRGDGRSYLVNISTEGYYDITWNDIYHYVLYTRGGPYWQITKIPFSKFVLGSKGRLQDRQSRVRWDQVTHFGISSGDKVDGRFNLEIEYVGLEFDPSLEEDFAYEMYKTDKYIVGV